MFRERESAGRPGSTTERLLLGVDQINLAVITLTQNTRTLTGVPELAPP